MLLTAIYNMLKKHENRTIPNFIARATDHPHTVRFLWKKRSISSNARAIW